MIGPLIWLICSFWFYKSAQKVDARPWPWVCVMIGTSALVYIFLAIVAAFCFDALPQNEHYESIYRLSVPGTALLDVGFIVALRSFMMKRAPFKNGRGTPPAPPAVN